MKNRDDIRKELQEIAPKLSQLGKKNPFTVPDFYFQSLPEKLLQRVRNEPLPWTERWEAVLNQFFLRIFQPRYALTFATCLVALAVSIGFLKNREVQYPSAQLSEISTEEIDAYILSDFDDYELVALNGMADIMNTAEIIPKNITEQELNEYLNDNIDNQTIEEEYL